MKIKFEFELPSSRARNIQRVSVISYNPYDWGQPECYDLADLDGIFVVSRRFGPNVFATKYQWLAKLVINHFKRGAAKRYAKEIKKLNHDRKRTPTEVL